MQHDPDVIPLTQIVPDSQVLDDMHEWKYIEQSGSAAKAESGKDEGNSFIFFLALHLFLLLTAKIRRRKSPTNQSCVGAEYIAVEKGP